MTKLHGVSFVLSVLLAGGVCRGAVINVPADQPTIQMAAGAVQPGDEIVLAPGTYTNDILPGFQNNFTIRGATGDPADVVFDGNGLSPSFLLAGENIVVRDITFEDCGNAIFINSGDGAHIENCVFDVNSAPFEGAPAIQAEALSWTIKDCVFTGNQSEGGAGAVVGVTGAGEITGCVFVGNHCGGPGSVLGPGGGAITIAEGSVLVEGCTFENNSVENGIGGAVRVLYVGLPTPTVVTIRDCVFDSNSAILPGGAGAGGAIACDKDCETYIDRCFFYDNTATFGGAISCGPSGTDPTVMHVTNSVFSSNQAVDGPAIIDGFGGAIVLYAATGPCSVTNCTFWANDSLAGGGVLDGSPASVLANNVFSANTAFDPTGADFVGGTPEYCLFSTPVIAGTPGPGCILGMSAVFVDDDGPDNMPGTIDDDLRLVAGTVGVDAGDSDAPGLTGIFFDASGGPRFGNDPTAPDSGNGMTLPYVDMGAYEIPGCPGDADGNGVVDIQDISYVIFRLGDTGVPGTVDGDVNNDGIVDANDISSVIFQLSSPCP